MKSRQVPPRFHILDRSIGRTLQQTEHPHLTTDLEEARLWVEQAIATTRQRKQALGRRS